MNKLKKLLQLTLIYVATVNNSAAMTFDRDYLYSFIESYVETQLAIPEQGKLLIEVSKIDPRISIQPCLTSLTANIPEKHNSRNVNVKIVCPDENGWQMFIPVKIQTIVPVLVTSSRLNKGTLLDNSNLQTEYRDNSLIRGSILRDANLVIGARLKRNLSKGAVVTSKNVCFVCKGLPVTITAKSQNFVIKSDGIALRDGSLGDLVTIRNEKSGRIIRAQVSAINQVIINL